MRSKVQWFWAHLQRHAKNYRHSILNETDEKPPHCLILTAQIAEREFRVLFSGSALINADRRLRGA